MTEIDRERGFVNCAMKGLKSGECEKRTRDRSCLLILLLVPLCPRLLLVALSIVSDRRRLIGDQNIRDTIFQFCSGRASRFPLRMFFLYSLNDVNRRVAHESREKERPDADAARVC